MAGDHNVEFSTIVTFLISERPIAFCIRACRGRGIAVAQWLGRWSDTSDAGQETPPPVSRLYLHDCPCD